MDKPIFIVTSPFAEFKTGEHLTEEQTKEAPVGSWVRTFSAPSADAQAPLPLPAPVEKEA